MKRWLEFLKERLPLPVLVIMSIGLSGSSQALSGYPMDAASFAAGTVLAFIFFLVMRVMDEVKDYKKDQIAHPERPLPRGLIPLAEARLAIYLGLIIALLGAAGVWVLGYQLAALVYALTCGYLFLMYKEFFISAWLEEQVLLYTFTHQIVLVFLSASLAAFVYPSFDVPLLRPGLLFLGIFFVYEIARKLDPIAHPLLQTYRLRFGVRKTGLLINFAALITIIGVSINREYLGLAAYLLAAGPVLIVLLYPRMVIKNHKAIEGLAGLWLLLILWTPFIVRLFHSFSERGSHGG